MERLIDGLIGGWMRGWMDVFTISRRDRKRVRKVRKGREREREREFGDMYIRWEIGSIAITPAQVKIPSRWKHTQ